MGKKRQEDFQKKKLRLLPKGRNVTKTTFKSKKITIKDQKGLARYKPTKINVEDLLNRISIHNETSRYEALCHLKCHIVRNRSTFAVHLPEIFNKVTKHITDIDEQVREAAVNTLKSVLVYSSDLQVESYFPILTSNLNCAMTHSSFNIRCISLMLLDKLLNIHPGLICHSMNILNNLLDMISSQSVEKKAKGKKRKRILETVFSDTVGAQDWRFMVLDKLSRFLKAMLKAMGKKQDNGKVDDKEIIWNGKQPLCLQLYAGSGLKPVELESSWHWYMECESTDNFCWRPRVVKEYIADCIPLLQDIFTEEILEYSLNNGCLVSSTTIERLNKLINVLCRFGDWVKLISNPASNVELWFAEIYIPFHIKLLEGFPYFDQEAQKSRKKVKFEALSSVQLNLAICELYSAYVLKAEYSDSSLHRNQIIYYLKKVFKMDYEACYDSAPMLIDITKNYMASTDVGAMIANLVGLYQILKVRNTSSNQKLLMSFFIELSLNPDYSNLSELPVMENWFELLLGELKEMMLSNTVDKSLLSDIRKISCRKYPYFQKLVNEMTEGQYLELLCFEDEDFQETVVCLICQKSEISSFFLKKLSVLIHRHEFNSLRSITRIIRMLTCRFLHSSVSEKSEYLKFLVNVACDTFSIDAVEHFPPEIIDFLTEWKLVQPLCAYCIYPSTEWKNHSELYEVCTESFLQLFNEHKLKADVMTYVERILVQSQHFPVHCLIAICRLKKKFSLGNIQLRHIEHDLMYSIMLFASVFSLCIKNEEMFTYSVTELFNSFNLNRKMTCYFLQMIDKDITENAHHVHQHTKVGIIYLRILKFLMIQKLLILDDRRIVIPILEKFKEICNMESFQSLWMHICNFFGYF